MFARVFALLPLALLVSASNLVARDDCNDGSVNCCNMQTYEESKQELHKMGLDLAFLNLAADAPLGFDCSPISGVGVGGNSCTQQTVCCDNNGYYGLVNVGCSPINVGL